jgi:hypothetical protein
MKPKIGNMVVLTAQISSSCYKVDQGVVCKVVGQLDENHVEVSLYKEAESYDIRKANISKMRLPKNETEKDLFESKYQKANMYSYARIN